MATPVTSLMNRVTRLLIALRWTRGKGISSGDAECPSGVATIAGSHMDSFEYSTFKFYDDAKKRVQISRTCTEVITYPALQECRADRQKSGISALIALSVAQAATMPIPVVSDVSGRPVVADLLSPDGGAPDGGAGVRQTPLKMLLSRLQVDHMLRNSLYLILSAGLQSVLGFAFWIIVARLFSAADVGRGSSLISAIGLISYLAMLGLNNAFVRYLPTAPDRNVLITSGILLVATCGAGLGMLYVLATPVIAPRLAFVAHRPIMAIGFMLLAAAAAVNLLTDSIFIASRKASYTALTDGGVGGSTKIIFAVVLAGTGAYGLFSASVGGFAAAALASLILMATALRWRPTLRNPLQALKPLLKFSGPNYVGSILTLLPTLVVPLIVLDRLGASEAAYYFVAFQIANLLYAAGNAIGQSFLAEGSQAEVDWRTLLRRSLWLLVGLFLPVGLALVVAAHWVLLAFGTRYSEYGTPTLVLLAVAAVPIGANDWLQAVLRLSGGLRAIVSSSAVSAIAICVLAWFLAPYGLSTMTAAWAIGSALGATVAGIAVASIPRYAAPKHRRTPLVSR